MAVKPRRRSLLATLGSPPMFVWVLYVLLVPIYIFKSGLPQPGDLLILVLIPVALYSWNGKLPAQYTWAMRPLQWFTMWVITVDVSWALIHGQFVMYGMDSLLLWPFYYIYNLFIFVIALVLYRRYGEVFLKITIWAILITLYAQAFAAIVFPSAKGRTTVFFENPNQLGYFALLSACSLVLLARRVQLKPWVTASGLISSAFLSLVSSSRSATAGIALLVILLVFSNPRLIVGLSIVVVALLLVGGPLTAAYETSRDRAQNRTNQVGFAEERGYDRIVKFKEYVVLGAGEGYLSRWAENDQKINKLEIHSSAGMIVFSYGIPGVVFFLLFMWRLMKGAPWRATVMLIPPFSYTIAHQGLRFTPLWILLALFLVLKDEVKASPAVARTR